jgi:hypothetical protein
MSLIIPLFIPFYYLFGFLSVTIVSFLDGIINKFTRYNTGVIIFSLMLSIIYIPDLIFTIISLFLLCVVAGYDTLLDYYVTFRKTIKNTLKMIELEKKISPKENKISHDEINKINEINNIIIYFEDCLENIKYKYNESKNHLNKSVDTMFGTTHCQKTQTYCKYVTDHTENVITILKNNALILLDLLLDMNPIKFMVSKSQRYYELVTIDVKEESQTSNKNESVTIDQMKDMNNLVEMLTTFQNLTLPKNITNSIPMKTKEQSAKNKRFNKK